jgi:hypothetical protein
MRFFCLWFQKLETSRAPWCATRETNCPELETWQQPP